MHQRQVLELRKNFPLAQQQSNCILLQLQTVNTLRVDIMFSFLMVFCLFSGQKVSILLEELAVDYDAYGEEV